MTPEEFRAAYLMPKGFLEKRLAARRANATYADLSGVDNIQLVGRWPSVLGRVVSCPLFRLCRVADGQVFISSACLHLCS